MLFWNALHLPGHRVLFTGDMLANARGATMPGVFNIDSVAVERAVLRFAELDVDTICVGHGDVLRGAAAAVRRSRHGARLVSGLFGRRCPSSGRRRPDRLFDQS
ncbi:MBL fold metallo-hydrolase [Nocardia sp. 2YAB30]|uniref:MBL fold metallo-hydrolase n=1 Tax=unclassified Nocardia TaxID=2637762 RepID=UPI003F99DF94